MPKSGRFDGLLDQKIRELIKTFTYCYYFYRY